MNRGVLLRLAIFSTTLILILSSCAPAPYIYITDFQITPSEINAGGEATLRWDVSGATRITIDNEIGDVPPVGKKSVQPTNTTTYTLTSSNSSRTLQEKVTVVVNPIQKIEIGALSITPSTIEINKTATLCQPVKNVSNRPLTHIATLHVDGQETQTKSISLAPSENSSICFEISKAKSGIYKLSINGAYADLTVYHGEYYRFDGFPDREILDSGIRSITDLQNKYNGEIPCAGLRPNEPKCEIIDYVTESTEYKPTYLPFKLDHIEFWLGTSGCTYSVIDSANNRLIDSQPLTKEQIRVDNIIIDGPFRIEVRSPVYLCDLMITDDDNINSKCKRVVWHSTWQTMLPTMNPSFASDIYGQQVIIDH